MFTEEHLYTLALRRCRRIGDITFHKLIQEYGSAKNVWEQHKEGEQKLRITNTDIGNEAHITTAKNELDYCSKNGIKLLLPCNTDYPELLKNCDDAPAHIFYKGELPKNKILISIVGTRNITSYGKLFIQQFLAKLPKNCATVSGLALGIDTEVHEKSLDYNVPTIGVLAHGFSHFYPAKNRQLSERILENGGCLLTEFLSHQRPERELFLQRNRIIAGLSAATLVVETAYGGGSISTVTFANSYNRDVYALPGRIHDKYSQGCNQLIVQNKAIAIANITDLMDMLQVEPPSPTVHMPSLFEKEDKVLHLPTDQKKIYQAIESAGTITLDDLAYNTEVAPYLLLPLLLEMELNGLIKSYSGRQFSLNTT